MNCPTCGSKAAEIGSDNGKRRGFCPQCQQTILIDDPKEPIKKNPNDNRTYTGGESILWPNHN